VRSAPQRPAGLGLAGALAQVLILTLTLALTSCGGGGGGGGGGGPTAPQAGLTFTAEGGSAPAVRLLTAAGTSGTTLVVQVQADQLSGVYGLAFDLSFPSGVLRYDGSTEGTFLSAGGATTTLQVAEAAPGQLVVGASRLGDVGATGGSGQLMTLRFTGIGAGSGTLSFSATKVFDASGDEIRGPSWLGGTVQVTP